MSERTFLPPVMVEATRTLAQNLLSSAPFTHHQQAQQDLDADVPARSLLDALAQIQARVRKTQANSVVTPEDIRTLRDLQSQAQANPVIAEYTASQPEVTDLLRETNKEISQLLGIDFALIARRSICCQGENHAPLRLRMQSMPYRL